MTCANHPEAAVAAYCRTCGKPLCVDCKREAEGTVFCADHVPVPAFIPEAPAAPPYTGPAQSAFAGAVPPTVTGPYASPYTAPAAPANSRGNSPLLALFLGFIPGVGAIYNGQYAKGLIHAVIFGLLVSLLDSHRYGAGMEPLLGILLSAWIFYMVFEAYHTAKIKRDGGNPGQVSGLIEVDHKSGRFPVGALILIALGGILLLDTTNLISMERLLPLWPGALILIGAYMLYERMGPAASPRVEARDDRR